MKYFAYISLMICIVSVTGYGAWNFYSGLGQTQNVTVETSTKEQKTFEEEKQDESSFEESEDVLARTPDAQKDTENITASEAPISMSEEISQLVVSKESEHVETNRLKLLPPAGTAIYYGAFPDFGGPEDIVSVKRINDYIDITKQKIAWAYFSNNWIDGIVYPASDIAAIRAAGTVPFVRMMPRSFIEQYQEEPIYSMQNIIDGKFDTQLRLWAQQAKVDPRPLLVDFAVEPNGDWFSWSGIFNGAGKRDGYGDPLYYDGPERYRDAYRHIIDLFKEEEVTNVTWFFHADIYSNPEVEWNKAKYYYPGDDYIDWVGVSLYGPQNTGEAYWDTFSEILKERASTIREISSTKPLALLEFGVTDDHAMGNKALWLEDAFETLLQGKYLQFDAVSYWHESWEDDPYQANIRVDSSEESLEMFQSKVLNPHLQTKLLFEVQ